MSLSTPAEHIEPVLTWIEEHSDLAVANLQHFAVSRVSQHRTRG